MDNKIFLLPCNYQFGCATVLALANDGELLGSEFGQIYGNGFCSGAGVLRSNKEYTDKYDEKFGKDNYEIIYISNDKKHEGLKEAIEKCPELEQC